MLIATQNPFELSGVYPLPESQLDRFLFKLELTYGSEADELNVLNVPHRGLTPDMLEDVRPLLGPVELTRAAKEVDTTVVPEQVARAVVSLVRRTRELPGVVLGCSPRSAIHLITSAKANARLSGRTTVTIDDVLYMAPNVLPHRLMVDSSTTTVLHVVAAATAAVAREAA
jgi:MoxR-like ATPase